MNKLSTRGQSLVGKKIVTEKEVVGNLGSKDRLFCLHSWCPTAKRFLGSKLDVFLFQDLYGDGMDKIIEHFKHWARKIVKSA